MKSCWTLWLIGAWLATGAISQAQDQERPRRAGRQNESSARTRAPSRQDALIDRLRTELDLDEEQLVEFDRLAAEYRKSARGNAQPDERRELVEEMHRANRAGDRERVEEIRGKLAELSGPNPADAFFDQVEGILRDDQKEKLAKIRERATSRRGPNQQRPLAQLKSLKAELNLSPEQAKQYDQLFAELRSDTKPGEPTDNQADAEFLERLREAVEAQDHDRIRELTEELNSRRQDPREATDDAIATFFEKVEEILEPEQVRTLHRFRDEMKSQGRRDRADLQACFRYVSRLDLDEPQREALNDIRKEAREAEREARRDPEELTRITAETQQALRDILTDEQVAKFDQWLEAQKSGQRGRGPRGDRPSPGDRGRRGGSNQP